MEIRTFGPIQAEINHKKRTITLTCTRRVGMGVKISHRKLALRQLEPLTKKGYEVIDNIDEEEVSSRWTI